MLSAEDVIADLNAECVRLDKQVRALEDEESAELEALRQMVADVRRGLRTLDELYIAAGLS